MISLYIEEYQTATDETAIYPEAGSNSLIALTYVSLGLAGEAGEIANKVKKLWRDHNGDISDDATHAIAHELGDVFWYLARIAEELGYGLETIAQMNLDKLYDRKERGVIGGSGDTR